MRTTMPRSYDEGNAHNEVDRHTFVVRMREVAPGLCKWLEIIYPTDVQSSLRPLHVILTKAVVDTIGATCNVVLPDMQRTRAGFSTEVGVLGLRTIAYKTEAAYIASRNATHILCIQIRHSHRGDQNSRHQHLQNAIDALDIMVSGLDVAEMEPDDITQSLLNDAQNTTNRRSEALAPERVHLQAYSAKGRGHEISRVPSKTRDTHLSPCEFVNTVSRRLGVDVIDSGRPCCYCGRCRPADILCIPALALAQVLPNGARGIRTEPICLDIAVINALGQDHWRHTAVRPGSAADIYSAAKAARNDISNKCWAAGYHFWPIVHEIQGGMAKGADAAMRLICEAVGKRENTDAVTLRVEFMGRLAAAITRAATRAVQNRLRRSAMLPRLTCQTRSSVT